MHPATPSLHKVLPARSPQGITHFSQGSTHTGTPSPHKRVQDRAKPAARTRGRIRTPPPAFTNAESGDVAAFGHSLSPILLTWLPPSHLRLYSSIRPHGRRFIHPHRTQGTSGSDMPRSLLSYHPSAPSRCTQQHQAQGCHVHTHPYPHHFLPWSTIQRIQSQQLARRCLSKQILKITESLGT